MESNSQHVVVGVGVGRRDWKMTLWLSVQTPIADGVGHFMSPSLHRPQQRCSHATNDQQSPSLAHFQQRQAAQLAQACSPSTQRMRTRHTSPLACTLPPPSPPYPQPRSPGSKDPSLWNPLGPTRLKCRLLGKAGAGDPPSLASRGCDLGGEKRWAQGCDWDESVLTFLQISSDTSCSLRSASSIWRAEDTRTHRHGPHSPPGWSLPTTPVLQFTPPALPTPQITGCAPQIPECMYSLFTIPTRGRAQRGILTTPVAMCSSPFPLVLAEPVILIVVR